MPKIVQNSNGFTPNGGAEYRWGMKNRDFQPLSRYISETVQDTGVVTVER